MTDFPLSRFVPGVLGEEAAEMARRFQLTLVLSAAIGIATGLGVAGFDVAVGHSLEWVQEQGVVVTAVVPAVGLALVALVRWATRTTDSTTTDAYVRSYHLRGGRLRLRDAWPKLVASAATLGSGHALGFEGPSLLIGSTVGSTTEYQFRRQLQRDDAKVLMVAGAAAGVAAVFKAPLTGIVFALEVPYRADLARRAMLPSLVAAGSAYVTYVAIVGTDPLLTTGGSAPFDLRDLGGGLALGLLCGLLARIGAWAIGHAKRIPLPQWSRAAAAAVAFAALAPFVVWRFDEPVHLGPGYLAIDWALHPNRTLAALLLLFLVRAFATWLSVGAGGVGGLFIPLVTQGAITGAVFQHLVEAPNGLLFPTIGIAAFLGAGYRTPLAGVAFVAEATGQPGFLVPALLAAAAAQLVMGGRSFCPYQRGERAPDVTPLTRLPISEIMSPNPDTIDAALALDRTVTTMLRQNRRWAPVVADGRYHGLIAVTDIAKFDEAEWPSMTAADVARTDLLPAAPHDAVLAVSQRLRSSESEAVAVTDRGTVIGVVTLRDLSNVQILLDKLGESSRR